MSPATAERAAIDTFLSTFFGALPAAEPLVPQEKELVEAILTKVKARATGTRYILGSAVDYTLMAQKLSAADPSGNTFQLELTENALFERYQLVTGRNGKKANTLTLRFGQNAEAGMRGFEEKVVDWFRSLGRNYPSAYVYNTGQWPKSTDLLTNCFQLSAAGRYALCQRLLQFGLALFPASQIVGRLAVRPQVFTALLTTYPRSSARENAGLTLQAFAYGFFYADRQHLEIAVDKVRTGSSRQNRIGDVDGYYGLDLALTVEVKDLALTLVNYQRQLTAFLDKVRTNPSTAALVVAAEVDGDTRQALQVAGATVVTIADLAQIVATWDWHKQDRAVHAVLHYLAHVEQNPAAVARLLDAVRLHDPTHASLFGYAATPTSPKQ